MYPLLKKPRKIIKYPESSALIRSLDENINFLKQINETASEIFSLSDGSNSIEEIAGILSVKYNENYGKVLSIVKEFIYTSTLNNDVELQGHASRAKIDILGSQDYWIPTILTVELTYKCPLFCKHCYRECSMKRKEFIELDLIKKIAIEMKDNGILYVQLTGGDPLYHPNFNEIVEEFIKNGIVITILTSGFYQSDKIFEFFKKNQKFIAGVQVSIDGLTEGHNSIRGRKDAYSRSMKFISKLTELEYNIDVVTTLIDQNKDEVFELSHILKEKGVKRHRLAVLIDAGRSKENGINADIRKKLIVDEWIEELGKIISDDSFIVQLEEDHNFHSQHHCGAGFKLIRIDPDGFIHPCLMIDYPIYNLKKGTIGAYSEKYSNKFKEIVMPSKENCKDCLLSANCHGCISEGIINNELVDTCYWYDAEWKKTESF
ncbi:radical SAM protein [Candidatus Enterococcus ikei]|uniref:Radical SAM protein n=1 Tax=Candidatus Enterococcus ikei TaxID=2815326 RepID=A0ABS3GVV4_9ENTE|nr:radical SAM protein [Enterococcus sp. DIV0869a]MBO0439397.1 radical SAM protein [Enterococcus sp. DIV0869a]